MKARNLAGPQPSVRIDAPAADAVALLARHEVRVVLVLDAEGELAGVMSDSDLLRCLLPSYVEEDRALARVLEEGAADALFRRLEGKRVRDLLREDLEEPPVVDGEATLVEVAALMVRTRCSLVGVREGGRLVGGIGIDYLLSHLLRR